MKEESSRIELFPITFFAIVMGLSGFTLAWRGARHYLNLSINLDTPLFIFTIMIFITVLGFYLLKVMRFLPAVKEEFNHPIKMSFFPAFSISLILLSIAAMPLSVGFATVLFWIGIVVHLYLTLSIIGLWIHQEHFEIHHMNPAWFIPVVGNILVPIAGVPLGQIELSWFFFSIGLVFWLVLMTIFFYRIIFHNRLPPKLMPTLFILIAPPTVGFVAYLELNSGLDSFAHIIYCFGLFLTLFLLFQIRWFIKLPFALSWWAYSFPMASITIATFKMYGETGALIYQYIAVVLLGLVTALIALLLVKTVKAIRQHGICLPE